ncbi:MAG: hypothetical protein AAFR26_11175 [Cyanobacteria bacterium J06626_4]
MVIAARKSQLRYGLAAVALVCFSHPAQAQSADRGQANQLATLAFGYAQADQTDRAIALLQEAETYTGGDCFEANVWLRIGVAYQTAGDLAAGEKFLTQAAESAIEKTATDCYGSSTSPLESVLNRAKEYAAAGHLDLARQVADLNEHLLTPLTLAEIAGYYAAAGQSRAAKQVLAEAIADHQALVAQTTDSQAAADLAWVSNGIPRGMAALLIEAEHPDLAQFVIEQSELVSNQLTELAQTPDPTAVDIGPLLMIARLLIDLEQPQQAQSLLAAIVPQIQPSAADPLETIQTWVEAAQLYHRLDSRQATASLAQAQDLSATLEAPNMAFAQARIVQGYAAIGDFDQAKALAQAIDNVSERQRAYEAIAVAYARSGSVDAANTLVQSIGNPESARRSLVRAYLATEQYAAAADLAQQPDLLKTALPEVGATYCSAGLPEKVIPLLELSSSSENWLRQCTVTEFAQQGEFDQALALAQTITEPQIQASALMAIADQYTGPTADPASPSLWGRLATAWQRWFGSADVDQDKAVEVLDQALKLIQAAKE